MATPHICRSWLASDSARKANTRLEGPIAGKPGSYKDGHTPICRSWLASDSTLKANTRLESPIAGKPGSYKDGHTSHV